MQINSQITTGAIYNLNNLFYIINRIGDIHLEVIRSMRKIAVSSIYNNKDDASTLFYYSEMVKKTKDEKFYLLYREIIGASSEILNQSIRMAVSEIGIKLQTEPLEDIWSVTMKRLKAGDALLAFLPLIDASPGFPNNIYVMVTNLLDLKNKEVDDFTIRSFEKYAYNTVPHVTGCLLKVMSLAVGNKNSEVFKYSMNTFYLIALNLLSQKLRLELNYNDEVHRMIKEIYYFFTRLFIDDESLDDSLFDEILDVLTTLGLQCMILGKENLTIKVVSILFEACFHVAKIDKFGYEVPRVAKRIMMIGVQAIEMNIDLVTKKVLQALKEYDENIIHIVKEFHPRTNVDELKKEIDRDELIFESDISPKVVLNENVSNGGWTKSGILNPSNQ